MKMDQIDFYMLDDDAGAYVIEPDNANELAKQIALAVRLALRELENDYLRNKEE